MTDFPRWFDLKNYDNAENLTLRQWVAELHVRLEYYSTPHTGKLNSLGVSNDFGQSNKIFSAQELQLYEIFKAGYLIDVASSVDEDIVFKGLVNDSSVVKECGFQITGTQGSSVRELMTSANGHYKGVLGNFRTLLEIDLATPDKLLEREFKSWLKSHRSEFANELGRHIPSLTEKSGRIKEISDATMKNWFECQLLPYLDLKQWFLLNAVPLPTRGEIEKVLHLHPDQKEPVGTGEAGDTLRTRTEIHASNVYQHLLIMRSQLNIEDTEHS